MRKNLMFVICILVMIIMVTCAMMMGSLTADHRTLLLLFAAIAGDVYMICESRVIRAQSPLVIRDESAENAEHPPDCEEK